MTPPYEVSHDKLRVPSPRPSNSRDQRDGANAVDRDRDHNPDGTFKARNRAASGTGPKRKVRGLVPVSGRRLFDDLCRQIGADGGTLAHLHAMMAVSLYLAAAELSALARAKGLDTGEGRELDERATRKAEAGLREATAALETSRLFKRGGGTRGKSAKISPGGPTDWKAKFGTKAAVAAPPAEGGRS